MKRRPDKYAELYELWGEAIEGGFTPIPNELLRNQKVLSIDSLDLNILINLIRFWWKKDRLPYPSIDVMAREIGSQEKILKKHLIKLESQGYVKVVEGPDNQAAYDLSGLVQRLETKRKERFEEK